MDETPKKQRSYQPILATAAGILFVSTASIFIRFAQAEAGPLVIAASRLLIASLVLVPLTLIKFRHEWIGLSKKDLLKAFLSGLFLAFHFATWITSLRYTSVASSVVLVTTTPLWVAIFSPLILGEKIRKLVVYGLVISMVGGIIVGCGHVCDFSSGGLICEAQGFSGRAMLGNFLALVGAWMAAGYMLIGRQLRKKMSTIPYTALVYGVSALILTIVVVFRREPFWTYQPRTYLWLLALGIFPQLLGHSLFNWALKYISAAYVALTLLGEPIGTIILAYLFLRETPTLLEAVGAVLILVGILVGSFRRRKLPNGA